MGHFYCNAHGSVYSYVPLSSVNDIPTGAYIMQSPDGLDTRHDSAVPTAIVPLGHSVAIVMYGASMAIYPDGQLTLGVTACATIGAHANKNIIRFIASTFSNTT